MLYRSKFRFQNPIHQNYKHVCAVQTLLDFLPTHVVHSAVVFAGKAEFKTSVPNGVFTLANLMEHIESQTSEAMSSNRVQFCVGRIEKVRLSLTRETDIDHVENLRRKYGDDD